MPKRHHDSFAPYSARLRELPFVVDVRVTTGEKDPDRGGDGAVELELTDGSTTTLQLELKASHIGASEAHHLRSALAPDGPSWLVAAPYIGAALGDSLQALGINFIDRQGNCYVRVGDRFAARVQGRTPPQPPARSKEIRAPGYQVMFALLADPALVSAPQREVAAAAGTSRQPVADLKRRFVEEGILVKRGRSHAWVEGPTADLLDRWLAGYRATLRPNLMVGRFRLPVTGPRPVEEWLEEHVEVVQYGGTAGGSRLERHYRGPETVVHLGPPNEETRRRLKALPTPDGELVWMRHIGQISRTGATPDTVHPLLIYAELFSDPDPRAGEAGELIRERWLSWSL